MKSKIIKAAAIVLLLKLCINIDAQTVIREKVKIKPTQGSTYFMSKITDQYFPCGPYPPKTELKTAYQVVWAGATYAIDPGQQPLWTQGNSFLPITNPEQFYNIEVVDGGNIVQFMEFSLIEENGYTIGDFLRSVPSPLQNILGSDIRGTSNEWVQNCDCIFNLSVHKYLMRFQPEQSGDVRIRYISQNDTFYVRTKVVIPSYHLEQNGIVDNVFHNYECNLNPYFIQDYCSECMFPPTDETCDFQVTSGSEYGSLFNRITKAGGNFVSGKQGEVIFIANGSNPVDEAMVTISITPHISVTPIEISIRVLHYEGLAPGLNVTLSKTELSAGDTVDVFIKKYIPSSESETGFQEIEFNWGTVFEVGIKEGCEVGEILTSDGRRGTYFRDLVMPIKFIVAQSVSADSALLKLRVAADEPEGMATKVVNRKMHQANNGLINASVKSIAKSNKLAKKELSCSTEEFQLNNYRLVEAVAKNDEIKIEAVFRGDKTIWPVKTGGNSKTNIKVKLTKGGKPFVGQNIKIGITHIEGTGGHDHIDKPLPIKDCGIIKINGFASNPNESGITDINGEIYTQEICSSEFGGEYKLEVSLLSNQNIKCEEQITVKVLGLELLPINSVYDQIGGRSWHKGPREYILNHNHWGVCSLINAILQLSSSWYGRFSNVPKLEINDMSLPYGGKFDCFIIWEKGHSGHRTGINVDIRSNQMEGEKFYDENKNGWFDLGVDILYDKNNNGKFDAGQLGIFRNVAFQKKFSTVNFETEPITKETHWHLEFNRRG